jgi:hypothetical protein
MGEALLERSVLRPLCTFPLVELAIVLLWFDHTVFFCVGIYPPSLDAGQEVKTVRGRGSAGERRIPGGLKYGWKQVLPDEFETPQTVSDT